MAKVENIFSSAYYLQKWTEAEEKYAEEVNLAGVKSTKDGNSDIEFVTDRLKALKDNIEYYKKLYEKAYDSENNIKPNKRLLNAFWGC